jgi:ANTAR domain/GAF domain
MPSAYQDARRPPSDQSNPLHHPAVDAALRTAATLLGMEVVFIGGFADEQFQFARVRGEWDGIDEGRSIDPSWTFCQRMLASGQYATTDRWSDPVYRDMPDIAPLEQATSYVGVPITDVGGRLLGTLCGIDRRSVAITDVTLAVMHDLASIVAAHLQGRDAEGILIRRTPDGWLVAGPGSPTGEPRCDLTSAMVLADLISAELTPRGRPPRPDAVELSEIDQLRLSVSQLEHALAARVLVEQAIGVLAERQHSTPRAAFDRLRKASRSRGRKVHDLAREVVASVTDHGVPLPPELAGR